MDRQIVIYLAGLILAAALQAGLLMADEHVQGRYRQNRHADDSRGRGEGEGNETAGQLAAWLLAVANLPVMLSLLVKRTNRLKNLDTGVKNKLMKFNRHQKKLFMPVHYWLNPFILIIVLWHWLTSCCRSTALPEWGLLIMVIFMSLGVLIKYKLSPKPLKKVISRIHTHPYALIAIVVILTLGHLKID